MFQELEQAQDSIAQSILFLSLTGENRKHLAMMDQMIGCLEDAKHLLQDLDTIQKELEKIQKEQEAWLEKDE